MSSYHSHLHMSSLSLSSPSPSNSGTASSASSSSSPSSFLSPKFAYRQRVSTMPLALPQQEPSVPSFRRHNHSQCCYERRPLSLIHHYNTPPQVHEHDHRPRAWSASYTSYCSRTVLNKQQSRRGPDWQMSADNEMPSAGGYCNQSSSEMASAVDYRLGRYFDSMNSTPPSNNFRSISYKTAVFKPSTDSNIESNGLMKPIPRLPEPSLDYGLPVIRPKRSDSIRSTDSRTTTTSTASTLVPSKVTNETPPVPPQQPNNSPPIVTNGQTTLKKANGNGNSNGPVRRVRFADEPPAEYTVDNDSDSRGATPPGQAIVVVTKRLGPSLSMPVTTSQYQPTQTTATTTTATNSILSMSINRVPPPYPHHRNSIPSSVVNPTEQAAPVQDWRPKPTIVTAVPSSTVVNNGDYADDGYDSVNQTPSEGSVNSTTSSSGLPQSASPDHQQLDPLELPPAPTTRMPSYSSNATYTAPPAAIAGGGNYAYIKQPLLPRSTLPRPLDTIYASSAYQSSPLPSVAQPLSRQVLSSSSAYSSTLTLPTQSSSQYRWLPGRSPSSAFAGSTASLFTAAGPPPAPSPYMSSALTRTPYHHHPPPFAPSSLPLARAPSFRQLAGPEPMCIVAEHEFSSLLDSLPLTSAISRPNHL